MMTDFTKYSGWPALASVAALALALTPLAATAVDISVNALFSGKAVLVIDGGRPQTLSAGQATSQGVTLVRADSDAAVIEYQGRRQTLTMGQGTRVGGSNANGGSERVTLTADGREHFVTTGGINGVASNVALLGMSFLNRTQMVRDGDKLTLTRRF